jgi:flagellin-like protein
LIRKFYKDRDLVIWMVLRVKRGLSPIVATVLLIALAMILAMIIFLWARGWISEQIEKRGVPIESVCESVEIKVDWRMEGSLFINIVNLGPIYLNSLEIRQEGTGSSVPSIWEIGVPPLGSSSNEKEIIITPGTKKVIIYPQIMGNIRGKKDNKVTTCLNSGEVINL